MWIDRKTKKDLFIKALLNLKDQVLVVRGARQVGKTSFIVNALGGLSDYPQLKINLLYPTSFTIGGIEYFGRDFFGESPTGEDFLKNLEIQLRNPKDQQKPALIFIDEADRFPLFLESIQTLAEFSEKFKFIITGSNLENILVENSATGRKIFFDLYPITFFEFLLAGEDQSLLKYFSEISFKEKKFSDFFHQKLNSLVDIYIRIGGMPKIVDAYLSKEGGQPISEIMKDLVFSIEENVKSVLEEKSKLYEYEDVLRKIAIHSMSTLKFSKLQVQHAGRSEVKKLVSKTVGARVAHKIRLFDAESDLSKYIIFDCGVLNYLLNGSDLLRTSMDSRNLAILYETFVGEELIASMTTREDLFYWRSGNIAEVEYLLKSPSIGIDVKTSKGNAKSLNSLAVLEPTVSFIVKIDKENPSVDMDYTASLPNFDRKRKIPLVTIPHYLTSRLAGLLDGLK